MSWRWGLVDFFFTFSHLCETPAVGYIYNGRNGRKAGAVPHVYNTAVGAVLKKGWSNVLLSYFRE